MKSAKYSISQWNFVASFMTHTINTRPLCLAYQDQNLLNLTPACLIFGKNKSALTTDLDLGNNRLFESLRKLEGELSEVIGSIQRQNKFSLFLHRFYIALQGRLHDRRSSL